MPVTLISFGANRAGEDALLTWTTANETNSRGFAIEKANPSLNFEEIVFMKSKNSNTSKLITYSYTDKQVGSKQQIFYRLKQMDVDGKFSYPPIASIDVLLSDNVKLIYPNPFTNKIMVDNVNHITSEVNIFDIKGKPIHKVQWYKTSIHEIVLDCGDLFCKIKG
ncbi:MAG: hypothetical protein H7296_06325 [Bacteroidia bacterium]|nr:hypothetical protein [Bacteroidia bacterium]